MKNENPLNYRVPALCALVFSVIFSFAQTIKLDVGQEYKLDKNSEQPYKFVYGDASSSFLLRSTRVHGKPVISLEKYDGQSNLVFNKEINTNLKDLKFNDLIWSKNKFLVFTSLFDKNSKTNTIYGNAMDMEGNFDSKSTTLMKLEVDSKRNTGFFNVAISDDSSKVLVYGNPPYNKDDNQKFAFSVYNNNFEKQWEKIVTLPYKDKMVAVEDQTVSNKGDVYILIKKYEGDRPKEAKKGENGKEANYKYEVLAYTNGGSDFKEYVLDLNGKFVVDPTFKVFSNGNLACAGFYTNRFGGPENGVFYMTIDAETKSIKTSNIKEFSQEVIDAFGKNKDERSTKSNNQGLSRFVFRDFILRDDGGAVILAENHYVVENRVTDSRGMTYVYYTYYYNDIIAININPKGEIQWFARIPKRQASSIDADFLSYAPMIVGDKIYIVYNDNRKNDAGSAKTKYFNYKDGVAVIVTIDAEGKITKKSLFDLKDNKTVLYSKLGHQVSGNSMAVYMQKGNNYKVGIITVN